MTLQLVPYEIVPYDNGEGIEDSYRPAGLLDDEPFGSVDLRQTGTGAGAVLVDVDRVLPGAIVLGDDPTERVAVARLNGLNNLLGSTYTERNVGELVGLVATDRLTLVPDKFTGMMQVHIRGRVWWERFLPRIGGGATYTDTFTYDDGDLAGNGSWVDLGISGGHIDVASNKAEDSAFNKDGGAYWNDTTGDDQYSQCETTFSQSGTENGAGVVVRATDSSNHYRAVHNTTTAYMAKRASGTYSLIDSTSITYGADQVFYCELNGTSWAIKYNGSSVSSGTDSSLSSGYTGLFHSSNGDATYDNWEGGDLPAGGAASLVLPHRSYRNTLLRR